MTFTSFHGHGICPHCHTLSCFYVNFGRLEDGTKYQNGYECDTCGHIITLHQLKGIYSNVKCPKGVITYYERLPKFRDYTKVITHHSYEGYHRLGIFQFWNQEYIAELASAIRAIQPNTPTLEVCAGDGALSHYLRYYGINIVATDDGSWDDGGDRRVTPHFPVIKMDALTAIRHYKPSLVIASWIPYQSEVDCDILNEHPKHFIVIGEYGGCTGSNKFWDNDYPSKVGYKQTILEKADRYNICRTDYDFALGHSKTILYTMNGGSP